MFAWALQMMAEDETMNRMEDAITLFQETICNPVFEKITVVRHPPRAAHEVSVDLTSSPKLAFSFLPLLINLRFQLLLLLECCCALLLLFCLFFF